jgi:polar amino acid transport system substrate-binding protein
MRALRALVIGLLVLGLFPSLTAADETKGAPAQGRLQRILESRELRVGLTANQPPLNMKNKSGEVIGLEVDLVGALARAMGLEARFIEKPFAELLPALEKGAVDLVISGVTITPERNARVAFAGPYFISGKSVLTNAEAISSVESSAELDIPERTYAALAGSTSEEFVKTMFPRAELVATSDYDSAVQMVIDDKVDALIADFPICVLSVMRYPDADLSTLVTPFTIEPLGIALPPGDPLFVNLVENYLSTLEKTGLLTQLKARWFSQGDWVSELP